MTYASPEEQTAFGYLSAFHSPEHGYFGGYLIVSPLGRPLEFHCTAPVRPSRAQEILYGPTLRSYLVGEEIGSTLLAAARHLPRLILTDQEEAIVARRPQTVPILLVLTRPTSDMAPKPEHCLSDAGASTQSLKPENYCWQAWSSPFEAFNYQFSQASGSGEQRAEIVALLGVLAKNIDLAEPFGRIHDAICEAQRIGRHSNAEGGLAA
jgi:hypothetical protein